MHSSMAGVARPSPHGDIEHVRLQSSYRQYERSQYRFSIWEQSSDKKLPDVYPAALIMNGKTLSDRIERALRTIWQLSCAQSEVISVSHDELAIILGTDRPSISRCLNKMKTADLVKLGYKRISLGKQMVSISFDRMFSADD